MKWAAKFEYTEVYACVRPKPQGYHTHKDTRETACCQRIHERNAGKCRAKKNNWTKNRWVGKYWLGCQRAALANQLVVNYYLVCGMKISSLRGRTNAVTYAMLQCRATYVIYGSQKSYIRKHPGRIGMARSLIPFLFHLVSVRFSFSFRVDMRFFIATGDMIVPMAETREGEYEIERFKWFCEFRRYVISEYWLIIFIYYGELNELAWIAWKIDFLISSPIRWVNILYLLSIGKFINESVVYGSLFSLCNDLIHRRDV